MIPVSYTHLEYARVMPKNCVLLVDTYDITQGIKNAITVGLEMKERGETLSAIRIDSGDLSWRAKQARKMLDEAGLTETGIVLSNDLDEYTIKSIKDSGAQVNSWGVGTKLTTAYDQPALGGVYKLAAKRETADSEWQDLSLIHIWMCIRDRFEAAQVGRARCAVRSYEHGRQHAGFLRIAPGG